MDEEIKGDARRRAPERGMPSWVLREKNGKIALIRDVPAKFVTKKVAIDCQKEQSKLLRDLTLDRLKIGE